MNDLQTIYEQTILEYGQNLYYPQGDKRRYHPKDPRHALAKDFVTSKEVLKALRDNSGVADWVQDILRKAVHSDHPDHFLEEAQLLIQLIKSHIATP